MTEDNYSALARAAIDKAAASSRTKVVGMRVLGALIAPLWLAGTWCGWAGSLWWMTSLVGDDAPREVAGYASFCGLAITAQALWLSLRTRRIAASIRASLGLT